VMYGTDAAWITDASSSVVYRVSAADGHARTTIGVEGTPLDVFASHVPNQKNEIVYVLVASN
jgi:hypothetical protein